MTKNRIQCAVETRVARQLEGASGDPLFYPDREAIIAAINRMTPYELLGFICDAVEATERHIPGVLYR